MWKAWRLVPTRIVKISEEANLYGLIRYSLEEQVKFGIGAITCQKESEVIVWRPFLGAFEEQQEHQEQQEQQGEQQEQQEQQEQGPGGKEDAHAQGVQARVEEPQR